MGMRQVRGQARKLVCRSRPGSTASVASMVVAELLTSTPVNIAKAGTEDPGLELFLVPINNSWGTFSPV